MLVTFTRGTDVWLADESLTEFAQARGWTRDDGSAALPPPADRGPDESAATPTDDAK